MHQHRCNLHSIAITLVLFLVLSTAAGADELQQHLRDQYQGKTFLLRGFYAGDKLHYDAAGALVGSATPGDWTTDGVVFLNNIHISGSRLTIKARRLVVSSSHRTLLADTPKNQKKTSPLKIEAELGFGILLLIRPTPRCRRYFWHSRMISWPWRPTIGNPAFVRH